MTRILQSALALLTIAVASPADASVRCDRSCLIGVADAYLDGLVAHGLPARLVATGVRYTENGQELHIGDGLWATAERLGTYRVTVPDPTLQSVGIAAQVIESGEPVLVATRLKLIGDKIAQIEQIVSRKDGAFGPQPDISVRPGLVKPLPPTARVPRAEMIATANGYFEGLAHATDTLTRFDPDCVRHEDGMQTTSNPAMGNAISAMTCQQQFHTGFSRFITGLRDRRFLVDESTGIVFAMLFFDHAGTVKTVQLRDGSTMNVPPPFNRPYSFQLFEMFKIWGGRIREVEAVLDSVPYGMPSGWPAEGPARKALSGSCHTRRAGSSLTSTPQASRPEAPRLGKKTRCVS